MHKPLFRIAVGSVAAVGGLLVASAMPAGAATSVRAETMAQTVNGPGSPETTPVTFTITSTGTLGITVPSDSVDLGLNPASPDTPNLPDATLGYTGNFGAVTVTDMRASAAATWTASVSSTAFTNVSGSAFIIPVGAALYTVGAITAATGLTTGATNIATATPLPLTGTGQPVVSQVAAFDGDNGATWTPTIDIAVPALATVGTYTGTVTHSVS